MGTIILVRHGQASFGSSNYDQLSPLGFEQSQMLGTHLKSRFAQIDAIAMGGMRRHRETAETCLAAMDLAPPVTVDAGFNEYAFESILQAHTPRYADQRIMQAELAQTPDPKKAFQQLFEAAIARWIGGEHDGDYPESWTAFNSRCQKALLDFAASLGPSKTALVFTSGGFIGVTLQHLLGLSARQAFSFNWNIANASLTRLLYGQRGISLQSFNEHGHLESVGGRLLTFR